jgi:hypothetical protein
LAAAEGDGPRVEADTPVGGTNGLMSLLALADDDVVEEEEDAEGVEEEEEDEELFCMLLVIIAVTDDVCTFDTSSTSSEHGQTRTYHRTHTHARAQPHTSPHTQTSLHLPFFMTRAPRRGMLGSSSEDVARGDWAGGYVFEASWVPLPVSGGHFLPTVSPSGCRVGSGRPWLGLAGAAAAGSLPVSCARPRPEPAGMGGRPAGSVGDGCAGGGRCGAGLRGRISLPLPLPSWGTVIVRVWYGPELDAACAP